VADVGAISHQTDVPTDQIHPLVTVDYGAFVTGTTGAASGRGIAVDGSGNQFVTGGLDDGMAKSAYVKKYLPDGTPDSTFPLTTLEVTIDGVAYCTEGHGTAVDPVTGDIDVVGTALDPASGNQAAFLAQYDPTGTLLNLVAYGNDLNANSFNGITFDSAGDIAFTGTLSVPAAGHTELAVGAQAAGGNLIVLTYDLGTTGSSAGMGIAVDAAGTTAYIAGCAAAIPNGPQQGLLGWIDRHVPTVINFQLIPSAAGDVVVNSVATDAAGVYFAMTTPGGASVVQTDPTLTTFLNEYDFTDPTLTVTAIGLDAAGSVYVTGQSLNIVSGNLTAQITQLDGALHLVDTVQVGGSGTDAGLALAVKSDGRVVITGTTNSSDFSVTDGSTLYGTTDAFLVSYTFPD
jgi:sugar lactone lactonase YvrE